MAVSRRPAAVPRGPDLARPRGPDLAGRRRRPDLTGRWRRPDLAGRRRRPDLARPRRRGCRLRRQRQRPELLQQCDAIFDVATIGRVYEREVLDLAEADGSHLEDDGGQVRAQDLRLGKWPAGVKIVLRVEPHTDAGAEAAAAAGALVGRRLRNLFYRQPLDFGAAAIAGDAGAAGVDDVADARHGQGSFGHVRGENDPAAAVSLEDPVLFGGRKTAEQWQDFDPA